MGLGLRIWRWSFGFRRSLWGQAFRGKSLVVLIEGSNKVCPVDPTCQGIGLGLRESRALAGGLAFGKGLGLRLQGLGFKVLACQASCKI